MLCIFEQPSVTLTAKSPTSGIPEKTVIVEVFPDVTVIVQPPIWKLLIVNVFAPVLLKVPVVNEPYPSLKITEAEELRLFAPEIV